MAKIDPKSLKTYGSFRRFLTAAQNGDLPKGHKLLVDTDNGEFKAVFDHPSAEYEGETAEHVFVAVPLDEALTALMAAAGAKGKVQFSNA